MDSENLSLTWEDHNKTLIGVFERFFENGTLVDCTIAAEGQYLKAHKIVLSACSPYFELLFSQEKEKNPIIVLKDIKFQELRAIVDYAYCGKVNITEDRLGDFVDAAESLQINGLGGDHGRKVTGKRETQPPFVQRRGARTSANAFKRYGRSCISPVEKNPGDLSTGTDMSYESNNCESLQTETSVNVSSSQSPLTSFSRNSQRLAGSVCNVKRNNVEMQPSSSFMQPPLVSTEISLEAATSVVKMELQPMTKIFVSEGVCSMDSSEEYAEKMTSLDNDSENFVTQNNLILRENTNPYSEELLEDVNTVVKTETEPTTEIFVPESECTLAAECVGQPTLLSSDGGMLNNLLNEENANRYSRILAERHRAKERMRRYREEIKRDPQRYEEMKKRERERYKRKTEAHKIKDAKGKISDRERNSFRKQWRIKTRIYQEKMKEKPNSSSVANASVNF